MHTAPRLARVDRSHIFTGRRRRPGSPRRASRVSSAARSGTSGAPSGVLAQTHRPRPAQPELDRRGQAPAGARHSRPAARGLEQRPCRDRPPPRVRAPRGSGDLRPPEITAEVHHAHAVLLRAQRRRRAALARGAPPRAWRAPRPLGPGRARRAHRARQHARTAVLAACSANGASAPRSQRAPTSRGSGTATPSRNARTPRAARCMPRRWRSSDSPSSVSSAANNPASRGPFGGPGRDPRGSRAPRPTTPPARGSARRSRPPRRAVAAAPRPRRCSAASRPRCAPARSPRAGAPTRAARAPTARSSARPRRPSTTGQADGAPWRQHSQVSSSRLAPPSPACRTAPRCRSPRRRPGRR